MKKTTLFLILIIAAISMNFSFRENNFPITKSNTYIQGVDIDSSFLETMSKWSIADYDSTLDEYPIDADFSDTIPKPWPDIAGIKIGDSYSEVKSKTLLRFGKAAVYHKAYVAYTNVVYGRSNWNIINYFFDYDNKGNSHCSQINFIKIFNSAEEAKAERNDIKKHLRSYTWQTHKDKYGFNAYLSASNWENGYDVTTVSIQKRSGKYLVLLSYDKRWGHEDF